MRFRVLRASGSPRLAGIASAQTGGEGVAIPGGCPQVPTRYHGQIFFPMEVA
jgi:hypothetical protein